MLLGCFLREVGGPAVCSFLVKRVYNKKIKRGCVGTRVKSCKAAFGKAYTLKVVVQCVSATIHDF